MKITRVATAGSLESGDVLVEVSPAGGVHISVESVVLEQFGEALEKTVTETLELCQVTDASIRLHDRGALECTVKARVETALKRAGEETR